MERVITLIRKYRIIFFMGMLFVAILFGCTINSEDSLTTPVKSSILDKVKNGELEGISINLGATKKEVLDKYGNPIRSGNSEYGFTFYYDGFSLEFEDYADSIDQVKETSKVVLMNADPKTVGLTGLPDEIKGILGTPSREIQDDTGDNTFILEYSVSDYLFKITFDTSNSPVKYITLQIK